MRKIELEILSKCVMDPGTKNNNPVSRHLCSWRRRASSTFAAPTQSVTLREIAFSVKGTSKVAQRAQAIPPRVLAVGKPVNTQLSAALKLSTTYLKAHVLTLKFSQQIAEQTLGIVVDPTHKIPR